MIIVISAVLESWSNHSNTWFILHLAYVGCLFLSVHFIFSWIFVWRIILDCFPDTVNVKLWRIKIRILLYYSEERCDFFCFSRQFACLHFIHKLCYLQCGNLYLSYFFCLNLRFLKSVLLVCDSGFRQSQFALSGLPFQGFLPSRIISSHFWHCDQKALLVSQVSSAENFLTDLWTYLMHGNCNIPSGQHCKYIEFFLCQLLIPNIYSPPIVCLYFSLTSYKIFSVSLFSNLAHGFIGAVLFILILV